MAARLRDYSLPMILRRSANGAPCGRALRYQPGVHFRFGMHIYVEIDVKSEVEISVYTTPYSELSATRSNY